MSDSNQESPARAEDEIGSTYETDPREIATMAIAGLVIRESEVESLGRAYLDFEAKLMALREALAEACVEWEAWMSKGLDVEE